MTGRHLVVAVLASLALLVVALSMFGALVVRPALGRLHFLAPITSVAVPIFGLAVIVDLGWGIASGLVVVSCALLALSSPVLEAATGRLVALLDGTLPEDVTTVPGAQPPQAAAGRSRASGSGG